MKKKKRNKKKKNNLQKILLLSAIIFFVALIIFSTILFFKQKRFNKLVPEELKERLDQGEEVKIIVKSSYSLNIEDVETKEFVEDYSSVEVDRKDLDKIVNDFAVEQIIIDEPFDVLIEESLEITKTSTAHGIGYRGDTIRICVIDTGVNAEVLGLVDGENFFGYNVLDNSENYSDDHGHGTKIMSVLTSFAPYATYYMVKALDENGKGYSSDIVAALEWCEKQSVDLYSLSIGSGSFEGFCNDDFVAQKVNDIAYSGTPVFAAAGNKGERNLYSPACAGLASPVAASTKSDTIADFSNYNENTLLVAPGEDLSVIDRDGNLVIQKGTSLSTPMVAGVAALALEMNAFLDPIDLENYLIQTGDVINLEEREFSRVNAHNILRGRITNSLTRANFSYEDWENYLIEAGFEERIFETLIPCTSNDDCSSMEPSLCIEGTCYNECNDTFDGNRCSDDSNGYTSSSSGICATDDGISSGWQCDKDEVAFFQGSPQHWADCYDITSDGAPTQNFSCDSDVDPSYNTEGTCSYSTGVISTATVNCDLDEVCQNASDTTDYYLSDCEYCGYDEELQCDSDTDANGYVPDGVCTYHPSNPRCDTGDVCFNGTYFIPNMNQCDNNDTCDDDTDQSGFDYGGLVCEATCVVNGSVADSGTCCHDANCQSGDCSGGTCAATSCPSVPLVGKTFSIKNSTGGFSFAVNTTGEGAIYGSITTSCEEPAVSDTFSLESGGNTALFVEENGNICVKGNVYDEQTLTCGGDEDVCVKNNQGTVVMIANITGLFFSNASCYDYNSGTAKAIT